MIDMWNAVIIGVGCLAVGALLAVSRERRRAVAAALSAFAVGLRSTASTSTRGSGTDGAYPGTTGRRILEAREVDL